MSDSVGGVVTMGWILIFIAVVAGYMAFNVNYTKAFRMKNKIIDCVNKYGDACFTTHSSEYSNYAKEIGYHPRGTFVCPSSYGSATYDHTNGFCYYKYDKVKQSSGLTDEDIVYDGDYHYYKIVTKVDIDIPIIQNMFELRFLTVYGDTKTIKKE